MAYQMRSRCTDPRGAEAAKSADISADVRLAWGLYWRTFGRVTETSMDAKYDWRLDRLREWCYQMAAERNEEKSAESDADPDETDAVNALRAAAELSFRVGIHSWVAGTYVTEIMESLEKNDRNI